MLRDAKFEEFDIWHLIVSNKFWYIRYNHIISIKSINLRVNYWMTTWNRLQIDWKMHQANWNFKVHQTRLMNSAHRCRFKERQWNVLNRSSSLLLHLCTKLNAIAVDNSKTIYRKSKRYVYLVCGIDSVLEEESEKATELRPTNGRKRAAERRRKRKSKCELV